MSEKLKFVLSNKDTYDPFEGQKKARLAKLVDTMFSNQLLSVDEKSKPFKTW